MVFLTIIFFFLSLKVVYKIQLCLLARNMTISTLFASALSHVLDTIICSLLTEYMRLPIYFHIIFQISLMVIMVPGIDGMRERLEADIEINVKWHQWNCHDLSIFIKDFG